MNSYIQDEMFRIPLPPLLSREDFVKKYMPQYARDYRPPMGIRMVRGVSGNLHVQMSTKASITAQVTKRNNRIDAEYSRYCAMWKSCKEMEEKQKQPALL